MSFDKNISTIIRKNVSQKYSQKLIDHAKQSARDALKTASKKKVTQRTAEATTSSFGMKSADKTTKASRTSQQNSSGANKNKWKILDLNRNT